MEIEFQNRDIISITDFTRDEILYLCKQSKIMYDQEKSGRRYELIEKLKTRTLASLFYEPSTRTRTSFNTAMRELGGKRDGFSGTEGTSVMKKETIRDTIMMMDSNHFDIIVMRHPLDGSVQWAADVAEIPVINGGDGINEHPTQALLDIFTIYLLNKERLDDISIGFGGDLSHGRTIRSLSLALSNFKNITIRWASEDALGMPDDIIQILRSKGVKIFREANVQDVISKVQFYYMTRPQLERIHNISKKDVMDMMKKYKIDLEKVKDSDIKLMHPLPVNSEIAEIEYNVYFDKCQAFFQQAENGIFLRKVLLNEILKDKGYKQSQGKLNPFLQKGNNRLRRVIKEKHESEKKFIDNIPNGTVIDHLIIGTEHRIVTELMLTDRGLSSIPACLSRANKSFLKTDLLKLNERELKKISIISPEPTINYIRDGRVVEKFVYLLCRNDNCITRVINEDVPPKFYNDSKTIKCRYCRKPYSIINKKVSEKEKEEFVCSLPKNTKQTDDQ